MDDSRGHGCGCGTGFGIDWIWIIIIGIILLCCFGGLGGIGELGGYDHDCKNNC